MKLDKSAAMKARWADPAWRERQIEACRAGHQASRRVYYPAFTETMPFAGHRTVADLWA